MQVRRQALCEAEEMNRRKAVAEYHPNVLKFVEAAKKMEPVFKRWDERFKEQRTWLKERNFQIKTLGGFAPYQIEGRLPDGRAFYFRCRHDSASLQVGDKSWSMDGPIWYVRRDYKGDEWPVFLKFLKMIPKKVATRAHVHV